MDKKKLSVVVSVFNEEQALNSFYNEIINILSAVSWDYELLFINDGSMDRSLDLLKGFAADNDHVKVISFSRNFGHEAAMIAGIDYSTGNGIVCMDADLQHPPACIPDIVKAFDDGYQVVNMVRTKNSSAGLIKNITSGAFYKLMNHVSDVRLEENASDFFGISSKVADVLKKNYREKVRFLRGYVQNVGFKKINIEYEAAKRVAGKSKYSIKKLFKFSVNTIVCFSNLPLKLGTYAGFFATILGIIMAVYTIWSWCTVGTPNGYATIIVLICFMFAILFVIVGIIGEYISILFAELKDRPIYVVEEVIDAKKYPESED